MSGLNLWQVLSYTWFLSEVVIAFATRTRRGGGNVRDRGTLILLWVVIFSAITGGTWFGAVQGRSIHLPGVSDEALARAAIAVLACGLVLRWTAVISLGKAFSSNVAIRTDQKVLKTGLYRWMRHPSYTGLLICLFAMGLHMRNWIALLIIVVPTTAALLYRIHVEEIALREAFGEEYVEYSRRTKRLIPGIY